MATFTLVAICQLMTRTHTKKEALKNQENWCEANLSRIEGRCSALIF